MLMLMLIITQHAMPHRLLEALTAIPTPAPEALEVRHPLDSAC
jgi:hypothetical protein